MQSHSPKRRLSVAQRAVAQLLALALVAGGVLTAETLRVGVEPAGATVDPPSVVWNTGTMCDGAGRMASFWHPGLPVGNPFGTRYGLVTVTRAWVPSGATLAITVASSFTGNARNNFYFGVQEAGNGPMIS